MNPTEPSHPWSRLTRAARTIPDDRDTAAPYGFATRVAALAFAAERGTNSLLERFSLRALGIACALTMVTVAANYSVITNLFSNNDDAALLASDDPVAELVDIASN